MLPATVTHPPWTDIKTSRRRALKRLTRRLPSIEAVPAIRIESETHPSLEFISATSTASLSDTVREFNHYPWRTIPGVHTAVVWSELFEVPKRNCSVLRVVRRAFKRGDTGRCCDLAELRFTIRHHFIRIALPEAGWFEGDVPTLFEPELPINGKNLVALTKMIAPVVLHCEGYRFEIEQISFIRDLRNTY